MMISNWKKPFGFHGLYKICQRYKGQMDELRDPGFNPLTADAEYI